MPLTAREREEQAVLAAHDLKKQQRERDRIDRVKAKAVLALRYKLALKGKSPTREEIKAAEVQAVREDEQERMIAASIAEDDRNGVPLHRRIRAPWH